MLFKKYLLKKFKINVVLFFIKPISLNNMKVNIIEFKK